MKIVELITVKEHKLGEKLLGHHFRTIPSVTGPGKYISIEDYKKGLEEAWMSGAEREYNDYYGPVPNPKPTFQEWLKEHLKE